MERYSWFRFLGAPETLEFNENARLRRAQSEACSAASSSP